MKFVRAPPETIPDDPADFESNSEIEIQLGVCLQLGQLFQSVKFQSEELRLRVTVPTDMDGLFFEDNDWKT